MDAAFPSSMTINIFCEDTKKFNIKNEWQIYMWMSVSESKKYGMVGSFISYARKIFRKIIISYPLIRTRNVCVSGGKKC